LRARLHHPSSAGTNAGAADADLNDRSGGQAAERHVNSSVAQKPVAIDAPFLTGAGTIARPFTTMEFGG
jgi:hypothetical protein